MGWNVTTMPYQASSMASTCDPMDLDAMNVARDPRKPQMRCYNAMNLVISRGTVIDHNAGHRKLQAEVGSRAMGSW